MRRGQLPCRRNSPGKGKGLSGRSWERKASFSALPSPRSRRLLPPDPRTPHRAPVLLPAFRPPLPVLPLRFPRTFGLCSVARPDGAALARTAARRRLAWQRPPRLGHLPGPAGGLWPPQRRAGHGAHLAGSLGSCDADLGCVRVVRLARGGRRASSSCPWVTREALILRGAHTWLRASAARTDWQDRRVMMRLPGQPV